MSAMLTVVRKLKMKEDEALEGQLQPLPWLNEYSSVYLLNPLPSHFLVNKNKSLAEEQPTFI